MHIFLPHLQRNLTRSKDRFSLHEQPQDVGIWNSNQADTQRCTQVTTIRMTLMSRAAVVHVQRWSIAIAGHLAVHSLRTTDPRGRDSLRT